VHKIKLEGGQTRWGKEGEIQSGCESKGMGLSHERRHPITERKREKSNDSVVRKNDCQKGKGEKNGVKICFRGRGASRSSKAKVRKES